MVTTPPVPPGRPEDQDDPTGVRALLAGLGDPGPMPAHLVDRINASIAAEQEAREPRRGGQVVPLRRRISGWPRVALVAAAVAAVAVGVPALLGTGPQDVMASLARGDSSSAKDASSQAGSAASGAEGVTPDSANRLASGAGDVVLAATGTAYTSTELTAQARTVLARGYGSDDSLTADRADNEAGLRACLTALGVEPWVRVVGDVATYDGRPAVVAVVTGQAGQSVYAVGPDCDATHPTLLAGPVPLG